MKLLEFESKQVLHKFQIEMPPSQLIVENDILHTEVSFPAMLKAQVPIGGRGKAGGVIEVSDLESARNGVRRLFSQKIRGYPVQAVLLETKASVEAEYYAAVTYDTVAKSPLVIFSTQGGVDVETYVEKNNGRMIQCHISANRGLPAYKAREVLSASGLTGKPLVQIGSILAKLVDLFLTCDATLAEINPLGRTDDGRFIALDCHLDIDEDALFRQSFINEIVGKRTILNKADEKSDFVKKAESIDSIDHRGVAGRMIEFDGQLGMIIGGGGASLTAFDAVRDLNGRPANYCEIGGNPSVRKVSELTQLILGKPGIEKIAVIMNVVSNTRVDLVARGIIKGILACGRDPANTIAVFRVPGSWEEEGFKILSKYGVNFCDRRASIDEAAKIAVESMQG
jgi:succinyl-CoA synthetase beta subunit/citryl-CoA synthetase large subunit